MTQRGLVQRDVLRVTICSAVLFLHDCGSELPVQTAEARVPVAARDMAREGLAAVPSLGGEPWLKKPPLSVWLQAISMRLFGESLAAATLPAVVTATALTALVTARAGLLAGLILILCPRFLFSARGTEMDIVFASLTGIAILLGHGEAESRGRVGWPSQLVLGLAVLAKGPLCLVFALFGWGRRWISPWVFLLPLPVSLWWSWASAAHPEVASAFIDEMFKGVAGDNNTHSRPVYHYLVSLPVLAVPAVLPIAVLGMVSGLRRLRTPARGTAGSTVSGAGPPRPLTEAGRCRIPASTPAVLFWLLGGLAVLSLMAKKQTSYALPLYPAVAILAAGAVRRLERQGTLPLAWVSRALAVVLAVSPIAAWITAGTVVGASLAVLVAGSGCLWIWRARKGQEAYQRLLLVAIPVFCLGLLPCVQSYRERLSLVPFGETLAVSLQSRGEPARSVATLGAGWEQVSWGIGEDLDAVADEREALKLGKSYLVREIGGTRAATAHDDASVVMEVPHPRHTSRRIQLLDLVKVAARDLPGPVPENP